VQEGSATKGMGKPGQASDCKQERGLEAKIRGIVDEVVRDRELFSARKEV
jgi:hypothetical protein